jgi:hypothetical protein
VIKSVIQRHSILQRRRCCTASSQQRWRPFGCPAFLYERCWYILASCAVANGFERFGDFIENAVVLYRNIRLRTLELQKAEWAAQDAQPKLPLDLDAPPSPTVLGGDQEGEALGPGACGLSPATA